MPLPLGPDTVTLIFRDRVLDDDDQQTYGADGRPVLVDRRVDKAGVKFTITKVDEDDSVTGTAASSEPPAVVYEAKCALPVDQDCMALAAKDAIEHDGKVFEMSGGARVKRTLIDQLPHHVRAFCTRVEQSGSVTETVVVTPRGGQDDDGRRLPDGDPVQLVALSVETGNTSARYGVQGTVEIADFTVVLATGSPVNDGDWIRVRGRDCLARVSREFSQHADRNQVIVLAQARTGG